MMHVQNNNGHNNNHKNNICASTQVGVYVRGIYTYIKKAKWGEKGSHILDHYVALLMHVLLKYCTHQEHIKATCAKRLN